MVNRWMRGGRLMAAAMLFVGTSTAGAQAVITSPNGDVSLGVFREGHLNYNNYGVRYNPTGFDGTSPGCLCEGWGAGVAGGPVGRASVANGGVAGLNVISFASTATTATSVVEIPGTMRITHAYAPSAASNLFQVTVTLENISGGVLGAGDRPIRYQRAMDWDIGPTTFSELVTIQGAEAAANVIAFNNDGFDTPDINVNNPGITCRGVTPENFNFTDLGPCDHGANFLFGFDALGVGETRSLTIFYGATGSEASALAQLGIVGAEIYSFGQCTPSLAPTTCGADGTPNTFVFGFKGVGGTVIVPGVPEPSTYILLATGLVGVFGIARRRRNA